MNRIYKHVWNKKQGRYVVASEIARANGPSKSSVVVGLILSGLIGAVNVFAQAVAPNALPTNPTVTSGDASFNSTTNKLTINQTSD